MTSRIELIRQRLQDALRPTQLDVIDDSHKHIGHAGAASGGGHYTVKIASPLFAGKTRIEKHKLIYNALGSMMEKEIHALKIKIDSSC